MVTARHGANHYKYAKPYLSSGIPMFIDKPVTVNGEEAVAFMREARENGVRICGSSCGKFLHGVVTLAQKVKSGDVGTIHGLAWATSNFFLLGGHIVTTDIEPESYTIVQ